MKILMALQVGDVVGDTIDMDKDVLQRHVDADNTGIVIARYGATEDDQIWGTLDKYAQPVHDRGYGLWLGGAWVQPVESIDEAIEFTKAAAEEMVGDVNET